MALVPDDLAVGDGQLGEAHDVLAADVEQLLLVLVLQVAEVVVRPGMDSKSYR